MTESNAISVRGLKKSFDRRAVLDFLDLTIAPGEAVGLLGANGAGKTTLLKSLLGLQPIDAGHCTVLGESSFSLSPALRARLAYVPQNPAQFPWLTGKGMLRYISAFYPAFDWDYVRDLTDRWKLALGTPIGMLSPGQQQRLSIVRALATRPDVILLDEPIAALDPATRIAVIDELIMERGRRVVTLLFSSHLIGDLERLCTQFAVLEAGRISLFEEVTWFKNLVRVTLQGGEAALEQMFVPRPLHIRKAADGRRVAVVDRDDIDRWSATLPASVTMTVDASDLEQLASEWMQ